MPQYTIEIVDQATSPIVEHAFLEHVIRQVLMEQSVEAATISVALVTDDEIHTLNRQFLGHDYPTDVISFRLDAADTASNPAVPPVINDALSEAESLPLNTTLNGELIVSNETAMREAKAHGWSPHAELLLYVVHGLLHLCGYDDLTDESRPLMRNRERELLAHWGLCPTGLEQ